MTLHDFRQPSDASPVIDPGPALVRIRFAVLWLVAGSVLAGTMAVFFYEPGVLEKGVAGEMEGDPVTTGTAMLTAAMVGLPLILAAITLFLPARAGAVTSLVAGVLLGAFGLFPIATHLAEGAWPPHLTLAALATAIAWLIVGLSIAEVRRRPHEHAASPPASVRVDLTARGA